MASFYITQRETCIRVFLVEDVDNEDAAVELFESLSASEFPEIGDGDITESVVLEVTLADEEES